MIRKALDLYSQAFMEVGSPAILERFCLRNGEEVRGAKRPRHIRKRAPKACFVNAAHLAFERGLAYYEGYALSDGLGICIHHAWNQIDGVVVDSTWKEPERAWYLGVNIPHDVLKRELLKSGTYGALDTGVGLNVQLMCELDPGMQEILDAAMQSQFKRLTP